ncbi:MAG: hypothetical protein KDC54_03010 [Lewinella sp.]|nr:hypothetical protein [Lewinella sp.]
MGKYWLLTLCLLAGRGDDLAVKPRSLPPVGGPFEPVTSEDGIELYERWHTQPGGGSFRELKAVFTLTATAGRLVRVLREEQLARQWMQRVETVRCRPAQRMDDWVTYVHYDLPWPARDHDCVLAYQRHDRTVRFWSVDREEFPEQPGITRMEGVSGRWVFDELGEGRVRVSYFIQTTQVSPLPRWVTDPLVRGNLLSTMAAYRTLAEQP